MANSQPNTDDTTELSFVVTMKEWDQLESIAFDESEPGDRVTVSQIGRDAIRQYLENHGDNGKGRDPRGRGALRNGGGD